jgi:hypothetical protein
MQRCVPSLLQTQTHYKFLVHILFCKYFTYLQITGYKNGFRCDSFFMQETLKLNSTHWPRKYSRIFTNIFFVQLSCFLGTFVTLQKATISFVMSICPHRTTQLPLDRLTWNVIFSCFLKICPENSIHYNLTRIMGVLHKDQHTSLIFWWIILEWVAFQTNVVEKINTHTSSSITFVWKLCHLWENV